MQPPDDDARIGHIVEALRAAIDFAEGRTRHDLDSDRMLMFALVRAVEIVGEAASKISPETRGQYPQIRWSSIIGMRNRLIHAYFDINRDILWTTVTEAVPDLLARITAPRMAPEAGEEE